MRSESGQDMSSSGFPPKKQASNWYTVYQIRSANLDLMQKLPLLQLSLFSVKMHLPSGDVIYMLYVIVLHCFCR